MNKFNIQTSYEENVRFKALLFGNEMNMSLDVSEWIFLDANGKSLLKRGKIDILTPQQLF